MPSSSSVRAAPLSLIDSTEPSVVFASLAARCVPDLCNGCVIDVVDGVHSRYRIANPSRPAAAVGLERLLALATSSPEHVVRVPFGAPEPEAHDPAAHDPAAHDLAAHDLAADAEDISPAERFHGVATFVWDRRSVTHTDRTLITLMVDHAVRTVVWERAARAARNAAATAEPLQIAVRSGRQVGIAIGILMQSRQVTEGAALELMTLASRRTNRTLRDVALDVIETGWLDAGIADDLAARRLRSSPPSAGRVDR